MDESTVVRGDADTPLDGEFVVFDIETTGLSALNDSITEIGAVLVGRCEILDKFSTFVHPERPIPAKIVQLTGITDDMVADAPDQKTAVEQFLDWADGRVLVAHNADFDMGFIRQACRKYGIERELVSLDTLELSRALLPNLKKHKLDVVANHLGLPDFNHHRACDDALTTAYMLLRFFDKLRELEITDIGQINHRAAALKGADLRRHHIAGGIGQPGIKIPRRLQIKQLAHILAGVVFKCGALDYGYLARLAVFRRVAALHAFCTDIRHWLPSFSINDVYIVRELQ